jgi:hypothetical protein
LGWDWGWGVGGVGGSGWVGGVGGREDGEAPPAARARRCPRASASGRKGVEAGGCVLVLVGGPGWGGMAVVVEVGREGGGPPHEPGMWSGGLPRGCATAPPPPPTHFHPCACKPVIPSTAPHCPCPPPPSTRLFHVELVVLLLGARQQVVDLGFGGSGLGVVRAGAQRRGNGKGPHVKRMEPHRCKLGAGVVCRSVEGDVSTPPPTPGTRPTSHNAKPAQLLAHAHPAHTLLGMGKCVLTLRYATQ